MVANRHTCCICNELRHPVEKHHINENPADNAWNNLAVVCRNCHGLVTQKGNLGSQYTPGEVFQFKLLWEKRCAETVSNELDSPVEELRETKVIEGGEHEAYPFDMTRGQELVFSIDANDDLDLVICDEEDINAWIGEENEEEGDEDEDEDEDWEGDDETEPDEHTLPEGYWHKTGVVECSEKRFIAPRRGRYVLLLVNWDDEATEVSVNAAVWSAEDKP